MQVSDDCFQAESEWNMNVKFINAKQAKEMYQYRMYQYKVYQYRMYQYRMYKYKMYQYRIYQYRMYQYRNTREKLYKTNAQYGTTKCAQKNTFSFPSRFCLEAVIRNLHETYQCRMYSRKLLMMGREDARNM